MKKKSRLTVGFVIAVLLFANAGPSFAFVRVGFLQLKNAQGEVIQLEPEFEYAHVAIAIGDKWLHAYPPNGVQLVTLQQLQQVGYLGLVLDSYEATSLSLKSYASYLGKPYDPYFSWDSTQIYCSELVAKILEIPPSPMHFDPKYWNAWYQQYEGKPGISPGKVYRELLRQGYLESSVGIGADSSFVAIRPTPSID